MRLTLRPLLPEETDWEKLVAFAVPLMAAAAAVWLKFRLPTPSCTLKHTTGLPCAGCGGTRAALATLEGRWGEALELNPMAFIGIAGISAYWILSLALMLRGRPERPRIDGMARGVKITLLAAIVAAILANWAWVIFHLPESPWTAR